MHVVKICRRSKKNHSVCLDDILSELQSCSDENKEINQIDRDSIFLPALDVDENSLGTLLFKGLT